MKFYEIFFSLDKHREALKKWEALEDCDCYVCHTIESFQKTTGHDFRCDCKDCHEHQINGLIDAMIVIEMFSNAMRMYGMSEMGELMIGASVMAIMSLRKE